MRCPMEEEDQTSVRLKQHRQESWQERLGRGGNERRFPRRVERRDGGSRKATSAGGNSSSALRVDRHTSIERKQTRCDRPELWAAPVVTPSNKKRLMGTPTLVAAVGASIPARRDRSAGNGCPLCSGHLQVAANRSPNSLAQTQRPPGRDAGSRPGGLSSTAEPDAAFDGQQTGGEANSRLANSSRNSRP